MVMPISLIWEVDEFACTVIYIIELIKLNVACYTPKS